MSRVAVEVEVGEYMSRSVVTVSQNDTLAYARNLMLRYDIGRLVVVEGGRVVGVLTLTDLFYALSLPELYYRPAHEVLVKEAMTRNPISVRPSTRVSEAVGVMLERNIGCLPVVDDEGYLEGIFTRTDALRVYAENYQDVHTAVEAMDPDPPTVSPYASLRKVIEEMERKPYMKVLVVDKGSLEGIIAKKDIVFAQIFARKLDKPFYRRDELLPKGRTGASRVYLSPLALDLMSSPPITANQSDDLANLARTMVERRIGALPLVDTEGSLLGLTTKLHVMEKLLHRT